MKKVIINLLNYIFIILISLIIIVIFRIFFLEKRDTSKKKFTQNFRKCSNNYDNILPNHMKYERKKFGSRWQDFNKNGLDTRQEVLEAESLIPVTYKITGKYKKRKKVISGKWKDIYTGEIYYLPSKLHIDHVVSVKEAWISGACKWTKKQRILFYNDLKNSHHLVAVSGRINRQKADLDIVCWLPYEEDFVKEYLRMWVSIKRKWKLFIDKKEQKVLSKYLQKEEFQDLKVNNYPCL